MIPSATSTARTCGLTRARRSVTPSPWSARGARSTFAEPCESTKFDALEIEDERRRRGRRRSSSRTRPRAPRRWRRTGRRRAGATAIPGKRLVGGVLVEVAEDLGAGLAAEQRHRRPRRDVDQPAEREHDADHHTREHPDREDADDRRHRDPEVEPRDPIAAAELGDVDHPEHDRVDDDRRRARPSAGRRTAARARAGSRARGRRVTSEATGVRAPADSFSELAERLVDTGIPWNTPGARRSPSPERRTPGRRRCGSDAARRRPGRHRRSGRTRSAAARRPR